MLSILLRKCGKFLNGHILIINLTKLVKLTGVKFSIIDKFINVVIKKRTIQIFS